MNLTNCKECGREIYSRARICPQCGNVQVKDDERLQKDISLVKTLNILGTTILVLGTIGALYSLCSFTYIKEFRNIYTDEWIFNPLGLVAAISSFISGLTTSKILEAIARILEETAINKYD